MRRVLPAIGLFLLSPLVAEFLLGNISVGAAFAVLFLAPLYGGGALLVREVTRRTGRGWSTILLLGLAYAVFEEGFATQSLFNPNYVGQHLLDAAYVPAVGMGGWWTPFVLTLHTVWSICVPIALVEALAGSRRTTPWLGRVGLTVTGVLFVLGAAVTALGSVQQDPFVASPAQFAGAGIVVAGLVVVAVAFGSRLDVTTVDGRRTPSPWLIGGASLALASLFLLPVVLWDRQHPWLTVGWYVVLYVTALALSRYWSASPSWGDGHRLALAAGALLAYAWHGFPQVPSLGPHGTVDLLGNAVFATGALALVAVAAVKVRRSSPRSETLHAWTR